MLGAAHFGAWEAINENFKIVGVAGTSSGSIAAALCAAGVLPDNAFESFQRQFPSFFGRKSFWLPIEIVIRALFGWDAPNDGSNFKQWLEHQFEQAGLANTITFKDLYQQNQVYLEVVACALNDVEKPIVEYSSNNDKKWMPISDAVRASISLPGIFKVERLGNKKVADGGLVYNLPIENSYELAKDENCFLIGVCFKKTERSTNWFNIIHLLLKSYEVLMSNSSKVNKEIKEYPKYEIIEIEDQNINPLNFNLSKDKLSELRSLGADVAREKLAALNEKLAITRSRVLDGLPDNVRDSVVQARGWFASKGKFKLKEYCQFILRQKNLEISVLEEEEFYQDMKGYLERVFESLAHPDKYDLFLEDGRVLSGVPSLNLGDATSCLKKPSLLHNSDAYLETLDEMKREINNQSGSYLSAKQDILKRIEYLEKTIARKFDTL